MLNRIRTFFDQYLVADSAATRDPAQAARCAAAALLLEMAHMDAAITPEEQVAIFDTVRESFGLSPEQAHELIACADEEREQATDYHQFTSLINAHFDQAQRAALVEQLWRVAYTNLVLCKHEEYLVRKVANLLHVPHQTFIAAKHRVSDGILG
ncbi:TerB family tellurite resistance protein [uncultured Thiodictyon sp.]|uniref:tellurite resistance TerB family protein n=1 Tax=uncultured Thiodictyon sp. TaxID=1846217 RepID=UPI0025EADF11|nr:TerB family tellurite resistance protein [uncultured Thiodictyon sp.]